MSYRVQFTVVRITIENDHKQYEIQPSTTSPPPIDHPKISTAYVVLASACVMSIVAGILTDDKSMMNELARSLIEWVIHWLGVIA